MPKYKYPIVPFTKGEIEVLRAKLSLRPWNQSTIIGRAVNQCDLKSGKLISNPFWPQKGPQNLTPYQVAFLSKRGYLPFYDCSQPIQLRYELSHICGNHNCVNVAHLKVETHGANLKRIPHHKLLVNRRKEELRARKSRRSSSGRTTIPTMPCTKSECQCRPRCFKNFVIANWLCLIVDDLLIGWLQIQCPTLQIESESVSVYKSWCNFAGVGGMVMIETPKSRKLCLPWMCEWTVSYLCVILISWPCFRGTLVWCNPTGHWCAARTLWWCTAWSEPDCALNLGVISSNLSHSHYG